MKIFVVFIILSFIPLFLSMRVAREQTSISLSLEYLGNCKQFDVDYHTLWVSNFVDGGCLPIKPDQTDRNDYATYTHICVRINDKKSIINFVGLPPSYALSFIPTNPFKTLKQHTLIRRPNCGVKQKYLSKRTRVVECTDNQVEVQTEYVVSDDRIYIFPAAANVSTCSIAGGCCPYINTIPNGGICPNTQPAGKLNLYFLPKHQEHHQEEEHRGEEYIPKYKLFKEEQNYKDNQNNYNHKKKETEDNRDVKEEVKEAKKDVKKESKKKQPILPKKPAKVQINVIEVAPKHTKQDKSLGKSVKIQEKEADEEIERSDDEIFSKKSVNKASGGHRHIGQAIKPNDASVKADAQASSVTSSKSVDAQASSVSSSKSVDAHASSTSKSVPSQSKQSGGSPSFHASFPSDESSHRSSTSSKSSSTYTSPVPSSNFPLPVDDTKDTDNVSFEDVFDDEPPQPSHSHNQDTNKMHTQPNKIGNPSNHKQSNTEPQDDEEEEESTPSHQSHASHTILSNKNSSHKNSNIAASHPSDVSTTKSSSNKNLHNNIPVDNFDEESEEESDDFIPGDDIFTSNNQASKKSTQKSSKLASIKKH